MSTEIQLLRVLGSSKPLYNRVKPHIKDHTLSKETSILIKEVGKWFETHEEVAWDAIGVNFLVTTKLSVEDAEMYKLLIARIQEDEEELSSADTIIAHYIKLDYANRIIDTAMKVVDGDKKLTLDDVLKNVMDYHKEVGTATDPNDVFTSTDISTVVEKIASGGVEWRLEPLNVSLGTFRQGDFIIIGARPESGKTTLIASELSHFGTQLDAEDGRPIIWVNNEENSDKVFFRVVQSTLGCTTGDIMADTEKAMDEYTKLMKGHRERILITEKNAKRNNVTYLTGLFAELKPSIIVFDQLDKVHGFEKESRDDLRLGKLYEWARELTENSAVLAVSQADGSAEGQRWIYQNQLRGSKTDKAGEADAIVTIGKANDASLARSRFIHIPKNKLFGGPRSDEAHRHGYWEVEIQAELARYKWGGKAGKGD